MKKNIIKIIVTTITCFLLTGISVFAGSNQSSSKYFTQDGIRYRNYAQITAGNGYVQGTACISRTDGKQAPVNGIGAQTKIYKSSGALLTLTSRKYNTVKLSSFSVSTSKRSTSTSCYCEGITFVKKGTSYFSYYTNRTTTLNPKSVQNLLEQRKNPITFEGQTFGSILGITKEEEYPDYIKVVGKLELDGYVKKEDLIKAENKSERSEIPVYNELGNKIIDSFIIENGIVENK